MKKVMLLVILLLPISLFAQREFIPLSTQTLQKINYNHVAVLMDSTKIPTDAKLIGIVIVHSSDEAKSYKQARKTAAKHGGNLVFKIDQKLITKGEKQFNFWVFPIYANDWKFNVYYINENNFIGKQN